MATKAQIAATRRYNERNYTRLNMYLTPNIRKAWEIEAVNRGISLTKLVTSIVNKELGIHE